MKLPLLIGFRGLRPSAALEACARRKAQLLDHHFPRVMACRVDIEMLQKHQHQGRPFGVRIHLTVPGQELTVDRVQHEDEYVALRDAFDDMRRQLDAWAARSKTSRRSAIAPSEPVAESASPAVWHSSK